MYRHTVFILASAVLLTSTAEARPQASTGGSRTTARTQCSGCPTSGDAIRDTREKLLLRIDSLRWEIDNRRLSDHQRDQAARELTITVRALQSSLDHADAGAAVTAAVRAERVAELEARTGTAPFAVASVIRRTRGYLGVTFDGPSAECEACTERVIRFFQYPRIAMVEPGSPAERAGVLEGDTLLSFNGTDVIRNEISLVKLLVPGSRIVMRVRRGANHKDISVTVGETPAYYARRALPSRVAPAMTPTVPSGVEPIRAYPPQPSFPMEGPDMPRAPRPGTMVWVSNEGVAGARVETINEGLGKAIGVKEGVLVIRAQPGTPAYRSGLRDGDVILSADGRQLVRVNDLRAVVARGDGEEGVKLVIVRERKRRDVTLRW
ncbi:MAG: PDZ domain-containing protein [Gemmatimonadaceae bacterium]